MNADKLKELALERFEYRDGNLYHKRSKGGRFAGTEVGPAPRKRDGYKTCKVVGELHQQHRIIFLMHHGHLPPEVDHIDGNTANNKIENLRAATSSENKCNCKILSNNKSGVKGVIWRKEDKLWQAQIRLNKKVHYVGKFKNLVDAEKAVIAKRIELHGEFANHGVTNG